MADGIRVDYHTAVTAHAGWQELDAFGALLAERPLNPTQQRIFLASSAEFFREIPGGILALALRITDDRIGSDRFGAVRAGANVLTAAVDEYGLGGSDPLRLTHHELFGEMLKSFEVAPQDLDEPDFIVPAARELAAVTNEQYRRGPLGRAVGFHFASEITSDHEFQLCYQGLARHATAFAFTEPAERALGFYFVHTLVEPEHGASSARALASYESTDNGAAEILTGISTFMQAYRSFWQQLREALAQAAGT